MVIKQNKQLQYDERKTWFQKYLANTHTLRTSMFFFRVMENKVRHLSSLYSTQGELRALGWDSNTSGILGLEVVRAGAMSHYKLRSAFEIPPSSGFRQQTL